MIPVYQFVVEFNTQAKRIVICKLCYLKEHVEAFFAQIETETGTGLPSFVKDEFEVFLECSILVQGFLRLCCANCAHEKLVVFFCKRRGFFPSCGGRRMAQTAVHLVDYIIPQVPVRQ